MATHTLTSLTDDMDGSPAATTIRFGYQGSLYEIDLSEANATAFADALQPYLDAARVVRGRLYGPVPSGPMGPDAKTVRAWARNAGLEVPARGRIPANVLAAYRQAHTGGRRP